MVRRSFTAVIEKHTTWKADFETEPYEAGWATEARWFIRVADMKGSDAALAVAPQVSPDGLFWCDEGREELVMRAPGLRSFALRDFGQWLRLRCRVSGQEPSVTVLIYLALKE